MLTYPTRARLRRFHARHVRRRRRVLGAFGGGLGGMGLEMAYLGHAMRRCNHVIIRIIIR